ncbi:AMP-binding protein, partial [Ralstonia pickettii]|nr:AMP-binding protein [Ralstonia pickettii]
TADAAQAATGPDTLVKVLFTSGSTRAPKAVPTTHRMLCSNQQMLLETFPQFGLEPPVLVDWLPWNHTFGGSHNVGIALYNGGTLYIDDGKPVTASSARRCATCARSRPPCISTCRRAGKNWPRRSKRMPRCAKPSSRA